MRVEAMDIPDTYSAYGVAASRDWPDQASLYRIVDRLWPHGAMLFAGSEAHRNHAFSAHGGSDYAIYNHTEYENALERDKAFLTDLQAQDGLLILFLGENPRGRTRQLAREADELGIPVVIVQPPPAEEPAILPSFASKIQRMRDVLDKLEAQMDGNLGVTERRRAYLDLALRHAHDLREVRDDLEAQIDREWAWLDKHPLRLDFCAREHTTLCRITTLTAILELFDRLQTFVTTNDPDRVREVVA